MQSVRYCTQGRDSSLVQYSHLYLQGCGCLAKTTAHANVGTILPRVVAICALLQLGWHEHPHRIRTATLALGLQSFACTESHCSG